MDQILKASYGDIGQRERNRRVPDPQQALAIYEAAKQRKHLQPTPEVGSGLRTHLPLYNISSIDNSHTCEVC